ncbi:MAG TPA: CDP-alcohol phosphatidyltransferase family protein, partial [Candidatus Thermoplasmatota archaeon]|nr:CDP-alcohol phosphatidyltransferase family protein [Candidatus Thermoplasmatota archaeon]
ALLLLSLVWDHSDGQVARRTGRGSVLGGLIDSIFDRLVESSWIVAIGADALLHPERAWLAWRPWQVLLVTTLALHADLYVRWSTALKSLAPLHQSLKRAYREGGGSELRIPLGARTPSTELGRTFFLPIYFGRDLSLWMLAGVAVLPDAALGLLAFGVAHLARGFELNWYTRNHLRDERRAYWKVLDPDYH